MAAKKPQAKRRKTTAVSKAPAPDRPDSAVVKTLGQLPALEPKLREAFRASFSDAQCLAWGSRTEAAKVLGEATRWLGPLRRALEQKTVAGYSQRRLTFLAELLVALEDEVAATAEAGLPSNRGARQSAFTYARGVRADLLDRLSVIAGGREDLQALVKSRDEGDRTLETLRDSLAGLIDLATRWRRDPTLELLSDDADLTTARLGGAYNALEALARTDELLRGDTDAAGDAESVNRIEGRVLRELHLALQAFRRAKQAGETVPALALGPILEKGFA